MKLFSKDGMEMMDIKSIERDGEQLVVKGKVMGAITTTLLVKPEDCWHATQLLGWRVILQLPWILLKGLLVTRKQRVDRDIA